MVPIARLKELARMGFKECIVPVPPKKADWVADAGAMRLVPCAKVAGLQDLLF